MKEIIDSFYPGSSLFDVLSNGVIEVAGSLNFESTPSCSLTLTVTDAGSLTDTAVVVISVSDVNENPSFVGAPYSATVAENDAAASVVTVSATDPDSGKALKSLFSFTLLTPSMTAKRCFLEKAQIQGKGPVGPGPRLIFKPY